MQAKLIRSVLLATGLLLGCGGPIDDEKAGPSSDAVNGNVTQMFDRPSNICFNWCKQSCAGGACVIADCMDECLAGEEPVANEIEQQL